VGEVVSGMGGEEKWMKMENIKKKKS